MNLEKNDLYKKEPKKMFLHATFYKRPLVEMHFKIYALIFEKINLNLFRTLYYISIFKCK